MMRRCAMGEMKINYKDDRATLTWDGEDQSLTIEIKHAVYSKCITYSNVPREAFIDLVSGLEEEDAEVASLQSILDRWEH
jgi:hypothetical protein